MIGSDIGHRITHAMFADDTLLIASTSQSLRKMISMTRDRLAAHGLKLNVDKCQIQTNRRTTLTAFSFDGVDMPIVDASVGFQVLGTVLTLKGRTSAEINKRIKAAWGRFHQLWPMLRRRDCSASKRLRLFDMCVTQTALWCNESWIATLAEKRHLRSTQHDMLRRIVGPRRQTDEDWVEWVQRSTREAKRIAKECGIRFWVDTH